MPKYIDADAEIALLKHARGMASESEKQIIQEIIWVLENAPAQDVAPPQNTANVVDEILKSGIVNNVPDCGYTVFRPFVYVDDIETLAREGVGS